MRANKTKYSVRVARFLWRCFFPSHFCWNAWKCLICDYLTAFRIHSKHTLLHTYKLCAKLMCKFSTEHTSCRHTVLVMIVSIGDAVTKWSASVNDMKSVRASYFTCICENTADKRDIKNTIQLGLECFYSIFEMYFWFLLSVRCTSLH